LIYAALELADCFAHQGKTNEAMELILFAFDHSATIDSVQQRAAELKSTLSSQIDE
jgi:hypothetical protein